MGDMKRILITGANGNIGTILRNGLGKDYRLTSASLPETDVRNYRSLEKLARGKDVLIHLAWKAKTENFQTKTSDPDNILMAKNAYEAALKMGVKKVIMASSVHADDFRNFNGSCLLSPNRAPNPQTPYGRSKIKIEEMGRKYAERGLEVVCIRFGAVGYGKPTDKEGKLVWLSDADCTSLIRKIVEAKRIPNGFVVMYGVSNNKARVHDFSNPFGWKPRDRI